MTGFSNLRLRLKALNLNSSSTPNFQAPDLSSKVFWAYAQTLRLTIWAQACSLRVNALQ